MTKNFLSNIRVNLEEMQKRQDQLSTGHVVQKPSDDPFRVARTMELKASLAANERYKQNIEECQGWLDTIDVALGQIMDVMQTIREETIAGGNGAYNDTERFALAKHFEQLKEHIVDIANTSYDGRYVFSGDKTNEKAFTIDPITKKVVYNGSTNELVKEMSFGVTVNVGVTGNTIDGIFNVIDKLIDKLNTNQYTGDELDNLDNEIKNLLKVRVEVGAKQNRLDYMLSKNEQETFNMTKLLSSTYDIDIAEKIMEYRNMEAIYIASLQTGAKILQPSLLDFLR